MAWEVKAALGAQRVAVPMNRARVTIERWSIGTPDMDGLVGGTKDLIDALLPVSKTHPCGLGIIHDDAPAHMDLIVRGVRVSKRSEQCTVVVVEEL